MKFLKAFCILLIITAVLVSCGKNESATDTIKDSESIRTNTETVETTLHAEAPDEEEDATTDDKNSTDVSESIPYESVESTDNYTEPVPVTPEDTAASSNSTTVTVPSEVDPVPATHVPSVMMYHLIRDDVYGIYDALFVRPSSFESHLITLNDLGYEYLFAEDWHLTSTPSVIITLDDGYVDNYTNMFPLLKKYGAKATVFLATNFIDTEGYLTREMIAEMSDSGLVSFQCHTASHCDLRYQSEDTIRSEFSKSVDVIEDITGKPVRAIAYPAGGYNSTVLSVVEEYFDFAYTTKSPYSVTNHTDLTIPRNYVARDCTSYQFNAFLR